MARGSISAKLPVTMFAGSGIGGGPSGFDRGRLLAGRSKLDPQVKRRQRYADADAVERDLCFRCGDRLEHPPDLLAAIGMRQHFVLVDLNDVLHTLDSLQIRPPQVPVPFMMQLRWGNDIEHDAGMLATADHGVGNARRVSLLVTWHRAAADFRPALAMILQAVAEFARKIGENDAMVGTGGRVRDDPAANKLVAPGRAEVRLVRAQEGVSVEEPCVACGGIHGGMVSRRGLVRHDPISPGCRSGFNSASGWEADPRLRAGP